MIVLDMSVSVALLGVASVASGDGAVVLCHMVVELVEVALAVLFAVGGASLEGS